MTDDEFLDDTAQRYGITPQQVLRRYVLLPCACGGVCCGWVTIPRSDRWHLAAHMSRDHPKPLPSITRDDFLAREQRRIKGIRYSWRPTSKGDKR